MNGRIIINEEGAMGDDDDRMKQMEHLCVLDNRWFGL